MNYRRRMKIKAIKAIVNGFRRKRRLWLPPQIITIEIPILASDVPATDEDFEKNFTPVEWLR